MTLGDLADDWIHFALLDGYEPWEIRGRLLCFGSQIIKKKGDLALVSEEIQECQNRKGRKIGVV
jgi:hypothetical protein